MMGSSAAQTEALAALLVLVTDPKKVAENIRALQEQLIKIEAAKKSCNEAEAAANKSIKSAEDAQNKMDARMNELSAASLKFDDDKKKYDNAVSVLAAQREEFQDQQNAHALSVKALDGREAALRTYEADSAKRQKQFADEQASAAAKLNAREDALAQRENAVEELKSALEKKLADLRKITHEA